MDALEIERVLHILDAADALAALHELFHDKADELGAMVAAHLLMRELYWGRKSLSLSVFFAQAGVALGVAGLQCWPDPPASRVYALKGKIKAISYDIASFTWAGWDEPAITIGDSEKIMGLQSAMANLRLAVELERPHSVCGRAHWMLAGHLLSAGDTAAAKTHYEEALRLALISDSREEVLLYEGYAILADAVAAGADRMHIERLGEVRRQLNAMDETGAGFAKQLCTATQVFVTF